MGKEFIANVEIDWDEDEERRASMGGTRKGMGERVLIHGGDGGIPTQIVCRRNSSRYGVLEEIRHTV